MLIAEICSPHSMKKSLTAEFSSNPFVIFTAILTGLLVSPGVMANEFYSLNLGYGEESNLSRGIDDFHERESTFLRAAIVAGKRWQLGLNDSITLSGNLAYNRFDELPGFDRVELGVSASYRYKFGFGPYAPTVNASIGLGLENSEGEARDTEIASLEISVGKRFQSGFNLQAGFDYQRNNTGDQDPDPLVLSFGYDPLVRLPFELFDFESASLFVAADYDFVNGWRANLGYRRIDGFTVASTTEPNLDIYKVSDAFYSDPAFPREDFRRPWFGYLLETNTDQWDAGLSIPLLQDTSINLAVSWADIIGPDSRDYDNTIYAITFVHEL